MFNFYKSISNSILIISICIFFITSSIKFTLVFKPLYLFDVNILNIEKNSNMNLNDINKNYDYIIKFLTHKKYKEFSLPTLPVSKNGSVHFQEVKNIFITIDYLFYISLILSILFMSINLYLGTDTFNYLKWSSICLILLSTIFIIPFIVTFNKSFNFVHKILFNNNYWIFDPNTDPIIKILPEPFFLHCIIFLISLLIINSFILFLLYKFKLKIYKY